MTGQLLGAQLRDPSTRPLAIRVIRRALKAADGAQGAAAAELGVGRRTLVRWLATDDELRRWCEPYLRPVGSKRPEVSRG